MKGKMWQLGGFLCAVVLLFGISQNVQKTKAVNENQIYAVTAEECFTFDEETGIITAYQETGASVEGTLNPPAAIQPATTVVIPASIRGVAVQGIAGAFQDNTVIQKVVIPDTLKILGDDTFNGCTSLGSVCVYKTGQAYTEEQATEKQNQEWGVQFVLSDIITLEGSLGGSGTSSGSAVTASGDSVFEGGQAYYEVVDKGSCAVIPASLTTLGERVFSFCPFASFDVMEGSSSFSDSGEGGNNLKPEAGAVLMSYDGTKLYGMASGYNGTTGAGGTYTLPEGLVEILPYAGQNSGWKTIYIPATVTTIGDHAFDYGGGNLEWIYFKEGSVAETIGEWAFAHNDNLTVVLPPSVKTIGKYCFAYIANRTPDISSTQITVIPEYAFEGCPNLHTITMPATLQVIEAHAFAGNANLNEVIFTGNTLQSIGAGAFTNCQNMHKIDIPEGVTSIEPSTFEGCQNLNTIILPDTLKDIKDNAFSGCQNIHQMVIPEGVTNIADNSFTNSNTQNIDTSKNAYAQSKIPGKSQPPTPTPTQVPPQLPKTGSQLKLGSLVYKFTKSTETGGTVTVMKAKSKTVKSIKIPASITYNGRSYKVTAINAKAFQKYKKLTKVTIGKNVKTIGKNAFANCKKLKKITIQTTKLTKSSVKAGAFKGIYKKATVKVPKSKLKAYKKFLRKKGMGKKVKIKK